MTNVHAIYRVSKLIEPVKRCKESGDGRPKVIKKLNFSKEFEVKLMLVHDDFVYDCIKLCTLIEKCKAPV